MECPYCGAELTYVDYYGRRKFAEHYWIYPQSWIEKIGDTYKCPNTEGFDNEEEKENFIIYNNAEDLGEDTVCLGDSFYTDERNDLHEGRP